MYLGLAPSIVILLVVVALACSALLLLRRRAPEDGYFNDSDRAAGVFGVLATGFAVLLGFIVFLAFASYDNSRSGAETEALVVAQQFETAQFMAPDTAAELGGELICYGRYVVHQEWPLMEDGGLGTSLNPWGLAMFRTLTGVEPEAASEEAAYGKWLDQTSAREEARQDRVHGADGIIPASLWIVLFVSAGIIFTYMLFFADSGERAVVQALLIGTVTAVIGATLLLISALNEPFHSGPGGLQPESMERTLQILEEETAGLGEREPLPCSDDGLEL